MTVQQLPVSWSVREHLQSISVPEVDWVDVLTKANEGYKPEIIPIESEETWLDLRGRDITSTASGCLIAAEELYDPETDHRCTPYGLYQGVFQHIRIPFKGNERVDWGKRMEPVIAQGIADDQGFTIKHMDVYMRSTKPGLTRMGSSFDYEAFPDWYEGRCLFEIKNVDRHVFKKEWEVEGEVLTWVPGHIYWQIIHQLAVSGYDACILGVLVGGNTSYIRLYEREDHEQSIIELEQAVARFIADGEAGREPQPNYIRDYEIIRKVYREPDPDKQLDPKLVGTVESMAAELYELGSKRGVMERREKELKAAIIDVVKDVKEVRGKFYKVDIGEVSGAAGKLIVPEMVGQVIGAREGYRKCQVRPIKKKGASQS